MDSDDAQTSKVFEALPDRTPHHPEMFFECLADVVTTLGLAPDPAGDRHDWVRNVRTALFRACRGGISLPTASFDVLLKAAVHDPDPSFNRHFVEPALNAFGRRRVRAALLGYLRTGTDAERAGAARAWYWSDIGLKMPLVQAQNPGHPESDDRSVLKVDWNAAALREFVANEHLDVRRSILPGLPLWKSFYPPELHDLVDAAVAIARSHPDGYIRHRVEHQLNG
ncbi:hypothetical protein [Kribbella yunnanensis]|uniref:hypothetical protein n=1 Tax=Kribbella yunnanensis TaxID=190194 RepID=UPI0031CF474A